MLILYPVYVSTAPEIDWSSPQAVNPDLQLIYQRKLHENNKPSMEELKDHLSNAPSLYQMVSHSVTT